MSLALTCSLLIGGWGVVLYVHPTFTRRLQNDCICVILADGWKMVYMFLLQLLPLHHGHENMPELVGWSKRDIWSRAKMPQALSQDYP